MLYAARTRAESSWAKTCWKSDEICESLRGQGWRLVRRNRGWIPARSSTPRSTSRWLSDLGLLESVYDAVLAYEPGRRGLRTVRQQTVAVICEAIRIDTGFSGRPGRPGQRPISVSRTNGWACSSPSTCQDDRCAVRQAYGLRRTVRFERAAGDDGPAHGNRAKAAFFAWTGDVSRERQVWQPVPSPPA